MRFIVGRFSPNVLIITYISHLEENGMGTASVTCNSCLIFGAHFPSILKHGASWNAAKSSVAIGYAEKIWHKGK